MAEKCNDTAIECAMDEDLILICRSGNRSSVIANFLAERAGYTKVYNVSEGILKWIDDGNPVVQ